MHRRCNFILALSLALALLVPALAFAQTPRPAPAAQPDPAYEAARAAFEALPEPQRKAIQEALVWTGDHSGVTSGGFGPRTFDAIRAYQRRAKLTSDGVLDAKETAGLQAAALKAREAIKFTVQADPRTGAVVGVPERLLPKRSANPNGGSRWQSADDRITLDTRAIAAGETELAALYERNLAIQTPGREVTYKVLRPDFFVISGETPKGRFYTRYASGPQGLRGFSIGYDKAIGPDFDRTVIAIANSFVPFPEAGAPGGGATVAAVPSAPAVSATARRLGLIATGLAVAPRQVVTSSVVQGCAELRAGGAPARVVKADRASGLALVEIERERKPVAAVLSANPPPEGAAVLVLSFAAAGSGSSLVGTPAEVSGPGRIVGPIQPGGSGAVVTDRAGAVIGLVGEMPASPRLIAGIVPPMTLALIGGAAVSQFIESGGQGAQPVDTGRARSAGEVAAALSPSLVSLECAR